MLRYLGNVRYPPETVTDLGDREWLERLWEHWGREKIRVGPPLGTEVPPHTAAYWEYRGMLAVYLDDGDGPAIRDRL